ncbi:hypothetical protein H6F90_29840 [Trichocoleus sp. FACHB-591]|uniref:hypothetical protein n=1 Tax=Trichocoleus sp. FACHB-591 TaxID=2692872 RepID=UPI00168906CB|nr:hypothetical protein [Trichocoleus sp. FACHB-591]MBD2099269.1 hypothetical protein [Trichocoleus sp. FACHB-591]
MPRKKITDLLNDELQDSVSSEQLEPRTSVEPAPKTTQEPGSETNNQIELQTPKLTESETPQLPKYLSLERKEVRLSAEQLDALTMITRRLNRSRAKQGERITDNTLIRVAIEMLIEHSAKLEGVTEEELLESYKRAIND